MSAKEELLEKLKGYTDAISFFQSDKDSIENDLRNNYQKDLYELQKKHNYKAKQKEIVNCMEEIKSLKDIVTEISIKIAIEAISEFVNHPVFNNRNSLYPWTILDRKIGIIACSENCCFNDFYEALANTSIKNGVAYSIKFNLDSFGLSYEATYVDNTNKSYKLSIPKLTIENINDFVSGINNFIKEAEEERKKELDAIAEKLKQERYKQYLELKAEFENEELNQ